MIWITVEDVIRLHSKVIQATGGLDGIRDRSVLESAVYAPLQTFGSQELFPSEIEKIARLGYGLASNHAFIDGNKRIGALITQLLLQWNGYHIELEVGELADMFISVADNVATETDLLQWIRQHLK